MSTPHHHTDDRVGTDPDEPFPRALPPTAPWERGFDPDRMVGGAGYGPMQAAYRALSDTLAAATPPPDVVEHLTASLQQLTETARRYAVPEHERWDGRRPDLPGRALLVEPPYFVDDFTEGALTGRVTFGRFHLGGGAAVHGGVPPLLFDDLLGMVANRGFDRIARTAYLHVEYKVVVPMEIELPLVATLDRVEGRKRFVSGRILGPDGTTVLCEGTALFVELRPGQP